MPQSADTARATSVARGPFHPGWGPRNSSRDERALAWFDELVWHDHLVCSNCFSRMKVSRTFARDDWGNEGSDSWRTEEATLEHGHDPLPDPPKTTCEECGSMGGLKQFDTLSAADAVDRVPDLIDRFQESGHLVDVRIHRPSQTLLLLDAGSITTVYALDELREDVYHAVKHAIPEER